MLSIEDISLRVAGRLLIERATAQIPAGARVGLVGRNGTGKSSLFRAIAGDIALEHGDFVRPARATLGRLPQEAPDGPESLIDMVLAGDRERMALLAEADTATDPHRIAEIQSRLADIGAHAAPARAAEILAGLGFSHAEQQRACSTFSGGWRMRVALATVLFAEPDLLLLDEPTNYLDLEGTLWLEDHLARYPRTVILISHDRELLDSAVDSILHLDRGKLTFYRGTYSSFERQRNERLALDLGLAKKQEAERARLSAFVERFRAKATKARQAQSRLKLLAKLQPIDARVEDEVREIVIPSPDKPLSPPIIALDNMTVGYEPGRPVLDDVSFTVSPGELVVIAGRTGAGKTTCANLLLRFWDPDAGAVTLNGRDLRAMPLDELRRQVAVVPQDVYLFAATVAGNLRLAIPDATQQQLETAARAANAHDFITALPEGYDTPLTERAARLSGGERQRLAIARALLHDAPVLLMDEAAASLDTENERDIQAAIRAGRSGRTTIVIAHRLSTIRAADRVVFLDNGKVAAIGPHDELLTTSPAYAELIAHQLATEPAA